MKLGLLGPKGTFSDVAREIYEKKVGTTFETYYFQSLNSVFSNYLDMDLLIVPIENTLDGHVVQSLDEMLDKKLYFPSWVFVGLDNMKPKLYPFRSIIFNMSFNSPFLSS